MSIFWALLIGIIQGLTELLPVSSSGHLAIAQSIIPNFKQPGVLFDVTLHLATTFAVVIYFRKKLKFIISRDRKYIGFLIVGTIPAAFVGVLFSDILETMFLNVKAIAWQLMLTGIMCILIDKFRDRRNDLSVKNSFLIGCAQALAIIPGISRSASTIFTGSFLGIEKKKAAEYSFLLSIPAILGANIFQYIKYGSAIEIEALNYLVGFIAALIFGYLSIRVVLNTLHKKKFKYFGIYCIILGITVLVFV